MKLVAVDLETTGLDPQRDQILQVGAVVFDPEDPDGVKDARFCRLVNPGRIEGDPFALQMNAKNLRSIAEENPDPWDLVREHLRDFIETFAGYMPHPVGFNVAAFDVAFLKANGLDVFHHRPVELGSLVPRPDGRPSRSAELQHEILGRKLTHDALQDAKDAAAIYRYWYHNKRHYKMYAEL